MMWRTHLMGGVASVALALPFAGLAEPVPLLLLAMLGSLLPDLDASESHIKHLSLGTKIEPFLIPSEIIYRTLGHRGLLHSLWGVVLFAVVAGLPLGYYFGVSAGVGLVLGYASHLLLDAMTKTGIPLLYPNRRRFHLLPKGWRVITGSMEEDLCFGLLTAASLFVLFFLLIPRSL